MILLVAATEIELCEYDGLACGVGPVEAAAATARHLALEPPAAVLHVGIAGARGVTPGGIVIGSEAVYCDISAEIPVIDRLEPDAGAPGSASYGSSRSALAADRHQRSRGRGVRRAGRGDGGIRSPSRLRARGRAGDRGPRDLERDLRGRPITLADRACARGARRRTPADARSGRSVASPAMARRAEAGRASSPTATAAGGADGRPARR